MQTYPLFISAKTYLKKYKESKNQRNISIKYFFILFLGKCQRQLLRKNIIVIFFNNNFLKLFL